jgi:hypothetical protein
MKAFDIQGDQVIFSPEFLAVPHFNKIWSRDKKKGKGTAIKELSFIVFLCDNTVSNPYRGYSEMVREDVLKEDFIGDVKWKPDELIQEAVKKLRALLETTSSRLLRSSQVAADKLGRYFENIDFDQLDDNGKPVYSARELASNLSAVGNIVKSLKALEEQVRKEQLDDQTTRGGFEIGDFEIPSDNIDYGESI